jgi:predicted DCC family thiol-disulfide oxidoreductase YuxK
MRADVSHPVILFDGACNLCSRAVQFVLKRDGPKEFRFAAMQSEAGRKFLGQFGLPEHGVEYIVLIEGGRCYTKSDAVIRIAARLTPLWRCWALVARLVPPLLRDIAYDLVARWRYRIFGKRSVCMTPPADAADRFV